MSTILRISTDKENMIETISFPWKREQNWKSHVYQYYFLVDASVMVMDVHLQAIKSNIFWNTRAMLSALFGVCEL